jgi:hypothetical protein
MRRPEEGLLTTGDSAPAASPQTEALQLLGGMAAAISERYAPPAYARDHPYKNLRIGTRFLFQIIGEDRRLQIKTSSELIVFNRYFVARNLNPYETAGIIPGYRSFIHIKDDEEAPFPVDLTRTDVDEVKDAVKELHVIMRAVANAKI